MSWLTVALADVADVNWGDTSVTKASYVPSGYPAFSATGCDGFLPYADYERDGIVLSAIGAQCGKTWFASGKWSCIKNTMRLWSIDDRLDDRFLYWVTSKQDFWSRRGAAQPFIAVGDARRAHIPLPPLDEQRRIVAILDKADALRCKRTDALSKLATLKSSIFLQMFGDWSVPGSRTRTVQLAESIDFLTSGSRGWAEYYRDVGALFIRIQNVRRDELDLSDRTFVDAPNTAEALRTRVQPGDVLLSITADLGRTAIVPDDIGEAYINQHLAILRTTRLSPRFLSAALASVAGQTAIQRQNREGVKAGLNFDDVRGLRIPDVPRQQQDTFARIADRVDDQILLQNSHLTKLDDLFASLQHRAFRGEL